MARSLSVDVNLNRRNNVYSSLSQVIQSLQLNDTSNLEWQRVFLDEERRIIHNNIERKFYEPSNLYRERMAFK